MKNSETPPPVPQKKRGCLFYGCITLLVFVLLICVGAFLAVRMVINKADEMVAEYTDTAPAPLPKVEMSADELKKLQARVAAFSDALKAHSNTPPFVLSGAELNAMMAGSQDAKDFTNKIYVSLEGDTIKGRLSLPLDDFDNVPVLHMFHLKGRYLNGGGTIKAGITNGVLGVYIQSLEVKGKPLPAQFMAALNQQNLAENANKGTNGAAFEQFESIQVKDGSIIITPKKAD